MELPQSFSRFFCVGNNKFPSALFSLVCQQFQRLSVVELASARFQYHMFQEFLCNEKFAALRMDFSSLFFLNENIKEYS